MAVRVKGRTCPQTVATKFEKGASDTKSLPGTPEILNANLVAP